MVRVLRGVPVAVLPVQPGELTPVSRQLVVFSVYFKASYLSDSTLSNEVIVVLLAVLQ